MDKKERVKRPRRQKGIGQKDRQGQRARKREREGQNREGQRLKGQRVRYKRERGK